MMVYLVVYLVVVKMPSEGALGVVAAHGERPGGVVMMLNVLFGVD